MKRRPYLKSRKLSRRRKFFFVLRVCAVFFVLIAITFCLSALSNSSFLTIKNIKISGNSLVSEASIVDIVDKKLEGNYFNIFSRRNIFLFPRKEIINDVLALSSKISSANVKVGGLTSIKINIEEFTEDALWCGVELGIKDGDGCFLLDKKGYIFDKASSGESYLLKYYGPIRQATTTTVGSIFILPEEYENISEFVKDVSSTGFKPDKIEVDSNSEVTIFVQNGGKIIFDSKDNLSDVLQNLLNLISGGEAFRDISVYENLDYLDLRFGNKIFYKLKNAK